MATKQLAIFDEQTPGTIALPDEFKALLPADLKELLDEFSTGITASFPVISIKGRAFTVRNKDDHKTIMRADDPDSPASHIDVVVLAANRGIAKAYYKVKYTEGSVEAPDCWSNDGERPDESVEKPVAKSCKTCPYNQFGSRITDDGKKAKMCSDAKRLAVASLDDIANPMLLRVPATSLKNWQQYVAMLARKGVLPTMVVTRIRFVPGVAFPQLEFKPISLLPAQYINAVKQVRESEVVAYITGKLAMPAFAVAEDLESEPEPAASAPAPKEEKPAKAPKAKKPAKEEKPSVVEEDEDEDDTDDEVKDAVDDDVAAILDGIDDL